MIVATPLHCHARHFLDTLAAGKDLFCEKTMTWSVDEADAWFGCRQKPANASSVLASNTTKRHFQDA
ncbi:MAG: Gfo/Idh/MocA family oxidoreductase [Acidobacteriota bacterium]